jgi:hypothetical protein
MAINEVSVLVRLSSEEREELKNRAWRSRMSVNAYVLDLLFPGGRDVASAGRTAVDEFPEIPRADPDDYVREPVYE